MENYTYMEPTPLVNQVQTDLPAQKPKPSVSIPLMILISIAVAMISSILTVLFISLQKDNTFRTLESTISNDSIPSKSLPSLTSLPPSNNELITSSDFTKRQYDSSSKFFAAFGYPQEILNTPESNLVGLTCTKQYVRDENNMFALSTDPKIKLTDPNILQQVSQAATSIPDQIYTVNLCNTQDERTIIVYEKWKGGGGMENVSYVGIFDSQDNFQKIATIPTDKSPYFSCPDILHLTTDNMLYLQCGGGDGGYGASSIYSINLNSKEHSLVQKCVSEYSDLEQETPKVTCQ